MIADFAVVN